MAVFAGQWGPEPFIDRRGNAVPSAVVTVYAVDGVTPAALYTDRTKATALSNPLPTGVASLAPGLDGGGNGIFFAAPGGYVLSVRVGSVEVYRGNVTVPMDPIEAAAGGGGGGGVSYRHVQAVAASVWTVNHNLGYRPGGIFVVDSGGTHVEGRVAHVDANTLTISFFVNGAPAAFGGEADIS